MKARIFGVLLLMVVMAIPAFAAYDMYLQIAGVAGTASDATHKDWIPVSEIQDSTISPGGVVSLVINKPIDGGSGSLYRDCLTAKTNNSAILDVCKDGILVYRTTLMNPVITQIKPSFTKKDTNPQEELSFSFKTINWEFYSADAKTVTTRSGWDNVLKRAM
jgi:type VI protein secretion system component Hcp